MILPAVVGQWNSPWRFVSVSLKSDKLPAPDELIVSLMEEANHAAASRIVLRVPDGGLLIGILNQRRFWTQSRARLSEAAHPPAMLGCLSSRNEVMSASGFFTGGIRFELPQPPINPRLIVIVHAVVERGLELLRNEPPDAFDLRTAKEDIKFSVGTGA